MSKTKSLTFRDISTFLIHTQHPSSYSLPEFLIMLWIDLFFRSAALASAIVATLRAGSRVAYLLEHDGIGIMDGPAIQNTNETYRLFELSEAFRHCVRLSIAPGLYEDVERKKAVEPTVEPYALYPRPYLEPDLQPEEADAGIDVTMTVPSDPIQNISHVLLEKVRNQEPFWIRRYNAAKESIQTIPTSIASAGSSIARMPNFLSSQVARFWNERENISGSIDNEEDQDEGTIRVPCCEINATAWI